MTNGRQQRRNLPTIGAARERGTACHLIGALHGQLAVPQTDLRVVDEIGEMAVMREAETSLVIALLRRVLSNYAPRFYGGYRAARRVAIHRARWH